ncbi:MAG TPA: hypothetical protein VII26_02350 [Candidatus Limnocylindria bacterium]
MTERPLQPSLARALLGPMVVLAGAVVTLPSMLGASDATLLNVGGGWSIAIAVVAVLIGGALLARRRGVAWAQRVGLALALFLVLYGVGLSLWGILWVAQNYSVPTADLLYLLGLPIISGVGGLISAWAFIRGRN